MTVLRTVGRARASARSRPGLAGLAVLAAALTANPEGVTAQVATDDPLAVAERLGWTFGEADAPVTVVEFTDVSCPYCASFHGGTRAQLHEEFVASGQVRWITLSYVSGLYPNSEALSVAAECAGREGRYEAFLSAAYADRDAWLNAGETEVAAAVARFAEAARVAGADFDACVGGRAPVDRLREVGLLARANGVRGTPTWFVDGFLVMGDLPFGYARQFIATRLPGGVRRQGSPASGWRPVSEHETDRAHERCGGWRGRSVPDNLLITVYQ